MVSVLAPRAGVVGLIATLAKWGVVIADIVSGFGAINKYTVGPTWTGAEYQTIQAAVTAADAAGHGLTYGGAVIEIYSANYSEAVVIPSTLRYWHMVGRAPGGNTGPFMTSLTVNVGTDDVDFSVTGLGFSGVTVNQAVAGTGTWYNNFYDCWFFGAVSVTGANLRTLFQDCHSYGGAGTITTNNLRTTVYGCEFLVSSAVQTFTTTDGTYFVGNFLNSGRLVVAGPSLRLFNNDFRDYQSPGAVADACTSVSYCFGNSFTGASGTVYSKTGASVLREGGNSFVGGTFPFFSVTAGSVISSITGGVRFYSGDRTMVAADCAGVVRTVACKTDGGGTITLPAPTAVPIGFSISVKDLNGNATATPITINVTGGSTIDGAASQSIFTNYVALTFMNSGANWFRVQG
jgi:hypothetical protein